MAPGLADTSKISTLFDIVIFYVSMAEEDNGIVSMMQENRMSYNRFVDQWWIEIRYKYNFDVITWCSYNKTVFVTSQAL